MTQPRLTREQVLWGLLRLSIGWLCLWAFLDKTLGLGFPTQPRWAWLNGGSPTFAFLKFGAKGILAPVAKWFLLNPFLDWLFMLSLLFVGGALTLGVAVRIGGALGAGLFVMMYLVGFTPPDMNPFLSEHVIYALLCVGFVTTRAGHWIGLGRRWVETRWVKRYPILE
ncbi:MAG: hypothetical protein HY903_18900 [Deltaproteobacteria bacterium]|nr:hypothetical protein [Deltaproteobacteria bacterium]